MVTQSFRRQDQSIRLVFRYENGDVVLADRLDVEMRPPPSEDLEPRDPAERSGFWVEVLDGRGTPIYRRGMRAPMLRTADPSETGGRRTVRPTVPARGTFTVVVPNLRAGVEVALFASPLERGRVPHPAMEMLRAPLSARRG